MSTTTRDIRDIRTDLVIAHELPVHDDIQRDEKFRITRSLVVEMVDAAVALLDSVGIADPLRNYRDGVAEGLATGDVGPNPLPEDVRYAIIAECARRLSGPAPASG